MTRLAEELTAQRAEERVGETLDVLLETVPGEGAAEGRAAHQGPEVDGSTTVVDLPDGAYVGQVVRAVVTAADGVDLVASAATEGK